MNFPFKDKIIAGIKVTGLILPTKYIWRPFGEVLEADRCVADGSLVTNSQESLSRHLGHLMRGPIRVSLFELILIWLRIIR